MSQNNNDNANQQEFQDVLYGDEFSLSTTVHIEIEITNFYTHIHTHTHGLAYWRTTG